MEINILRFRCEFMKGSGFLVFTDKAEFTDPRFTVNGVHIIKDGLVRDQRLLIG